MAGLYFVLPAQAEAVGLARRALGDLWDLREELLEELALLTSEVVTNALVHAGLTPQDQVEVFVDRDEEHLRVKVCDRGQGSFVPALRPAEEDRPGGWGLFIVDQLAARWGVERDGRTCVWFEVRI